MEDYPEYKYLHSQPWTLETAKNEYPKLYERIKKAVKDGNIIIEGGTWVEPDTNLPSGESLIRQFMFGKKFMKEDGSFGYTWSYPPSTSQAAPVCPHGIVEGDINGGTIATVGTLCSMCGALGVSVPIYSANELEKFNERIKKNCGYK